MTDLSPAAQAVLDAFRAVPDLRDCPSIAAALRAAADQVLAAQWKGQIQADTVHRLGINWARDAFFAIAAELEGNHPGSPDSSDGPAVSDDREPASVNDQLIAEHRKATADLVRKVIDQALRDTASVHWRVIDADGTQVVRVRDLLTWAEQTATQMETRHD